ncbi:MAG TPA: winged helix DNA-binding domain-containing protein [Verrucomicrobiae bacterium]|nr:winged helix DNA-binding domain-containing protein [Verrucomicrobiae bacterium]
MHIGLERLANLGIAAANGATPAQVVSRLGAMQAQDYPGALWSIGLRTANATEADVEHAIRERQIVRTWPMRGTLHFVAAPDVRWMLALLTPRILANARRRAVRLELDAKTLARCEKLVVQALAGGRIMPRELLLARLEQAKISTAGSRGYHILWRLAQQGVICFGPREAKQHTFVLLDEWLPAAKPVEREVGLAELARRYVTSHGPATLADFAGWAGLRAADARDGVDGAASALERVAMNNKVYWLPRRTAPATPAVAQGHLLPGFDEFVLGYKDREAVLEARHAAKIIPGNNGMFMPTIAVAGRIAGTWQRTLKKSVTIQLMPFQRLTRAHRLALTPAVERYARFLGMPVKWEE